MLEFFGFSAIDTLRGSDISLPITIPDTEHCLAHSAISGSALKVLHRLKEANHEAYLVGGCVRDLLLDRFPKDFDVVTDASPERIRELFGNSRLIGQRFRLVHVRFGRDVIEVATFRAPHIDEDEQLSAKGRVLSDNIYGSREEDAIRRDFTINCLYYDIRDSSIIDFAGGLNDLKARLIRTIGDPRVRYREDPVRMLRALRFSAKLGFQLEPTSRESLYELGYLLADIPPARLFDECMKLFLSGHALSSFDLLRDYHLFRYLFPQTEDAIARDDAQGGILALLRQAMCNTDERITLGKPITPGFLFATFLWEPVRAKASQLSRYSDPQAAMEQATEEIFALQKQRVSVPRRFALMARDIWFLQSRLEKRRRRDISRLIIHPRFRAAYDFLVLRGQTNEPGMQSLGQWWTQYQLLNPEEKKQALAEIPPKQGQKRRSRHKGSSQLPLQEEMP